MIWGVTNGDGKTARPGDEVIAIVDWGLTFVDDLPGTLEDVGVRRGCGSDTCRCWTHDPPAPLRRWTPPAGTVLLDVGDTECYLRLSDGRIVVYSVVPGRWGRLRWDEDVA